MCSAILASKPGAESSDAGALDVSSLRMTEERIYLRLGMQMAHI
jgi:hypothetical protein